MNTVREAVRAIIDALKAQIAASKKKITRKAASKKKITRKQ